jgi:XTP/dITP diphosphohydrolase
MEQHVFKLLIATANSDKLREMEALLAGLPLRILTLRDFPQAPEVVEDGATLEENAAKKAAQTARALRICAVADDSGLFVDALGGGPGVLSARYAGVEPTSESLCRKLLAEMRQVPAERRSAHFRCCIAMALPDGSISLMASGRCDGIIADQMRGGRGFGYDPVFHFEPAGKTFAQMEPEEKNAVSHRGRALRAFRRALELFLESNGA